MTRRLAAQRLEAVVPQLEAPSLRSLLRTLSVSLCSSCSESSEYLAARLNDLVFYIGVLVSWLGDAGQNPTPKALKTYFSSLRSFFISVPSTIANTILLNRAKFLKAELVLWILMASS